LGVAEAGYFPGMVYYLGRWFPERYRGRAISRFMIGTSIATLVGGPVGGLLLALDSRLGLAGWQWLFLVEGLPAVIFGVVALATLNERPADAAWLSADEKAWLARTLAREASRPTVQHLSVLETFRAPAVLLLAASLFLALAAMNGVNYNVPTI